MYEWEMQRVMHLQALVNLMQMIPRGLETYHVYGSFGDVYIQLSAIKEVVEARNKKVNLLVDQRYERLVASAFGNNANGIFVSGQQLHSVLSSLGVLGNLNGLPVRMLPTLYPGVAELIGSGVLRYADFLRSLLKTDQKGPFPKLETAQELEEEANSILIASGCRPGRTVLVCADNNTHRTFEENFWISIMNAIVDRGWDVAINDSGNLSSHSAVILQKTSGPRIKVPPHLGVTISKIAGSYISGTNGYATIQALFNDCVRGLHLINGSERRGEYITDNFGNPVREQVFMHGVSFSGVNRKAQIEHVVLDTSDIAELECVLDEILI